MRDDTQKRAQAIMRELNIMAVNENEIGKVMATDHPTLQQGAMRMAMGFIQAMASNQFVDDRNRASHELAKKLMAAVKDDLIYLPLI